MLAGYKSSEMGRRRSQWLGAESPWQSLHVEPCPHKSSNASERTSLRVVLRMKLIGCLKRYVSKSWFYVSYIQVFFTF